MAERFLRDRCEVCVDAVRTGTGDHPDLCGRCARALHAAAADPRVLRGLAWYAERDTAQPPPTVVDGG